MQKIIFYSWQSDLPNASNRGFIQQALENVTKKIKSDDEIDIEPVVDRDTQGMSGSPDIASTIFAKINSADIFVADISIINKSKSDRPTPNPNVLIELGYALKTLGHERIIIIFNNAFGKIEFLPFDLKMRRLVIYNMPAESDKRSDERKKLAQQLEVAIKSALVNIPDISGDINPTLSALEDVKPNRVILLRKNLTEILIKINSLQPKKHTEGGGVDDLLDSISKTQEVVSEFSKIVETAILMKDQESIKEIYAWFGNIFELYDYPSEHTGKTSNADHDYFKFLGYELFVTTIALLIREQRWGTIKELLKEPIAVKYLINENGPGNVYWDFACRALPLLLDESRARNRISLHADILNERHDLGGLSSIMPINEFIAADFFLFLYGELVPEKNADGIFDWRPCTWIYMKQVPMFIKNAENIKNAEQMANVFDIENVTEFKKRLLERYKFITKLFRNGFPRLHINDSDIERIGTK